MDREHPKTFCVVSHTHWDREWYLPLEQFRVKLVDLVDRLIETLDEHPSYVFHLDAQTIVLDDYLAIKPGMRPRLEALIREGRIIVGPWYVQNDFFLTSGESTIRNLLIGTEAAEAMGRCSSVGYAADQFGIVSQLPQILRGFGIDSVVFARGYSHWKRENGRWVRDTRRIEFVWRGPDGSELDAFYMAFWYNNAQRFSRDPEKALALVRKIENDFSSVSDSPLVLCMNGVDHLEAQPDLLEVIGGLNARLGQGTRIEQYTLERYIREYRAYRERRDGAAPAPEVWAGELREGSGEQILHGTLSSRSYLKKLNHEAQVLLESKLEPLFAMIRGAGAPAEYPKEFMRYLWKLLIQNQAHDSICGCGADAVHGHMVDRYARINETGTFLLSRGLEFIAGHIDCSETVPDGYFVLAVNTLPFPRAGLVETEFQFPVGENVSSFTVTDAAGKPLRFEVLSRERMLKNIQSPVNLPGNLEVDSFRCVVETGLVPACGYTVLRVTPASGGLLRAPFAGEAQIREQVTIEDRRTVRLENAGLAVEVEPDGRVTVIDKRTGRTIRDALSFDESEDCGDVYLYREGPDHETNRSASVVPVREVLRESELVRSLRLIWHWDLPERFDRSVERRSRTLVRNTIRATLTLRGDEPVLEVDLSIDNTSKDHRFRTVIRTGVETDTTLAASPFDLVRRNRFRPDREIRGSVEPFSGLLIAENERFATGIFAEGIHAYEHDERDPELVYLTLLRGNRYIFKDFDGVNLRNDLWQAEGNQCLGTTTLRLALCPSLVPGGHGDAVRMMQRFHTPILSLFQSTDRKKFRGGRPGVQDSSIREIFPDPDRYPDLRLAETSGFYEILGNSTVLSCLKLSEMDDMIILRVWNSGDEPERFSVKCPGVPAGAFRLDLNERVRSPLELSGTTLGPVRIGPKEIVTIGLI